MSGRHILLTLGFILTLPPNLHAKEPPYTIYADACDTFLGPAGTREITSTRRNDVRLYADASKLRCFLFAAPMSNWVYLGKSDRYLENRATKNGQTIVNIHTVSIVLFTMSLTCVSIVAIRKMVHTKARYSNYRSLHCTEYQTFRQVLVIRTQWYWCSEDRRLYEAEGCMGACCGTSSNCVEPLAVTRAWLTKRY